MSFVKLGLNYVPATAGVQLIICMTPVIEPFNDTNMNRIID